MKAWTFDVEDRQPIGDNMTKQQEIRLQKIMDDRKKNDVAVNDYSGPIEPKPDIPPPTPTIKKIIGPIERTKLPHPDLRFNRRRHGVKPHYDPVDPNIPIEELGKDWI